jgi:hypothetical protein
MTSEARTRRAVIQKLALLTLACAFPMTVARGAQAAGPGPAAPRDREAKRRWALARMDEMAQERLRCRERFKAPRQVEQCEAEFQRRHRAYNEIYLDASRE